MAVRFHVHVQPTASSVMTQVATTWSAVAVGYVPARGDRRKVQRYSVIINRQPPNASGERYWQTCSGAWRHARHIR